MKINIGGQYEGSGSKAWLDVPVFLRTRMLVQAASGQGKSHWLRRLVEQLFGHVQIFIIDVEGEFSTLRPTFDFAIIGEGGDAPADVRSAALLAQKLLELRTSAIFDLSEAFRKHPRDRHTWVKNFLSSMMEAPKRLWHPVVVLVDEAHKFAPEKDESEASDAMIALTTDGRKRQFCAVYATQRLGKLSKDAAAELLNVMIGGTVLDIDRKRAAEALGVYGKELQPFNAEIKTIERGFFWCLGPALSRDRLLTHVGPTETSPPKFGNRASAEPPPPTAKIKALLPQLADLPKLAVEKQQTEGELRKKILELEREARKVKPAAPGAFAIQKLASHNVQLAAAARKITPAEVEAAVKPIVDEIDRQAAAAIVRVFAPVKKAIDAEILPIKLPKALFSTAASVLNKNAGSGKPATKGEAREGIAQSPIRAPQRSAPSITAELIGGLSRPQMRILAALAQLEVVGQDKPSRGELAFFAGTRQTSSSFEKNVGTLKTLGFVTYPAGNVVALTDEGRRIAPPATALDADSVKALAGEILTNPEQHLFDEIYADFPSEALTREDLGARAGVPATSSSFEKNLGNLKTAGLITYPVKGSVRAAEWLFF